MGQELAMTTKSEKRETQSFKKRYGPRRHKVLGINKWVRKQREIKKQNPESLTPTQE